MQEISLNRTAVGKANNRDLGARATTTNEGNCGLRVGKGRSSRRIAYYGLVGMTVWLLLAPTRGVSQASSSSINLLDPKNGGQVLLATNDDWSRTIDGNESRGVVLKVDDVVVFAFKNQRPATFDTFAVLIPGRGDNVKEFELSVGNESPADGYDGIGNFTTTNAKVIKAPYQEFKFQPVRAKYLNVRLLSSWGGPHRPIVVYQIRLFGRLEE